MTLTESCGTLKKRAHMSLMNSLKHLVIEEDPNAAQPEPTPVAQSQRASGIPGIPGIPGLPSTPAPALPVTFPTAIPNGTSDANLTATFVGKLRGKIGTAPSAALLERSSPVRWNRWPKQFSEEGSRFHHAESFGETERRHIGSIDRCLQRSVECA